MKATIFVSMALYSMSIAFASGASRKLLQTEREKAPQCPLSPNKAKLDFSDVAKSCGNSTSEDFCPNCACALYADFAPIIIQAGLFNKTVADSEEIANQAISNAAELINVCTQAYMEPLKSAVDVEQMDKLKDTCPYGKDTYPDCLPSIIEQIMVATIKKGEVPREHSYINRDHPPTTGID